MRINAFSFLLLAIFILSEVNQNHAMRIKRGAAAGKVNGNILTQNASKNSELSETHKSVEKVSKIHETQAKHNDRTKEQVCLISKSDENKDKTFKKSTHENNLKDFKINIINGHNSAEKQNGFDNEDGAIKIFFVDTCAAPLNQNDKLKKHETNSNITEKKFINSNQRYTEEANKPFIKQDSQYKSHYDNSPKLNMMNSKYTNKEPRFDNGEKIREQNYYINKYNDKEISKNGVNLQYLLDEPKTSSDMLHRIENKKSVALNRPLLKIVAKYKQHGGLQPANSGLSNIGPLEGIINFANMLLYSINKDTGLQNNIADKETCIAQSQDFDDSSAMDYLYNIMDQNPALHGAGTMNNPMDGNSQILPSQKYFTNNEPSSLNLIENAIESIFSNDYDGENDFETVHCPVHAEYNNNNGGIKKNVDGTDDGVVQVCSCRLYKKNRDLHHF